MQDISEHIDRLRNALAEGKSAAAARFASFASGDANHVQQGESLSAAFKNLNIEDAIRGFKGLSVVDVSEAAGTALTGNFKKPMQPQLA